MGGAVLDFLRRALAAAAVLAVLPFSAATDATDWNDVCTSEEYVEHLEFLCPPVFFVSTMAFNPNLPSKVANVTLVIQPSEKLTTTTSGKQYIRLKLPGFNPVGEVYSENALYRTLSVSGRNLPVVGVDPSVGYNTWLNGVFESPAFWDTSTQELELTVRVDYEIVTAVDTEVEICCLQLPTQSVKDNVDYKIWAPFGNLGQNIIGLDSIQSTSEIDPGSQWDFLQVSFDPAVSKQATVISMSVRSADDLFDRMRIIFHMPSIHRADGQSGPIEFLTVGGTPIDWQLFEHFAQWDETVQMLTFYLRPGVTLAAGRQVTLQTLEGEFVLPVELKPNWPELMIEARSYDDVDEIIRSTSVMQSTRVPPVRSFTYSEVSYANPTANATTDVMITLQTNRPMFAGTRLYLRLSGFQAQVIEVPLLGDHIHHFRGAIADFHLTQNILELEVVNTLYSDEEPVTIGLMSLILPPALYENDTSLLIWSSDFGALRQPITKSPELGQGRKTFVQSQVTFSPQVPLMPAGVTFSLLPSINFFQGDQVVFYLFGFTCQGTELMLEGPDADKIHGSRGIWNQAEFTLMLTVAENKIITYDGLFIATLGSNGLDEDGNPTYPCTLPAKLTKNDGVLRVEGRGATILQELVKKSPSIGSPKFILDSRIDFAAYPEDPSLGCPGGDATNPMAKIDVLVVLNCDVLPNTTFYVKLGGLIRAHTMGTLEPIPITLSGPNAPLFVDSKGVYDPGPRVLAVKVVSTMWIYAGEKVQFFLERDQCFRLPFAAYANDPSFQLSVPEAGIPSTPFNYTTRINTLGKGFTTSFLYYGDSTSYIAYPNTVEEVNIKFTPNVKIFGGSIIQIVLPGFTLANSVVNLASPDEPKANEEDLSLKTPTAGWEQQTFTLTIVLPLQVDIGENGFANMQPYTLPTDKLAVVRVKADGGWRLPREGLLLDDPKLRIMCVENQIIYSEPIKSSPLVVDRTFALSQYLYDPPVKGSIFHFTIRLTPTVNVTEDDHIILSLPGFFNPLPGKTNIHIKGQDRLMIVDSMGKWNSTSNKLTLELAPGVIMAAFDLFEIEIEESQGFILPDMLDANDTRLMITAQGNIPSEPVKHSPMVGNGPFSEHKFCVYQFEKGSRTVEPVCGALTCDPPLLDPCSDAELVRCGCEVQADAPGPLMVRGFNLQQEDDVSFLPYDRSCGTDPDSVYVLHPFSEPSKKTVSETKDKVNYFNISSIQTGKYRVCVEHVGVTFDIGFVIVRPTCTPPLVMVDGTCVEHCPKTKIPFAGECQRDPHALDADDAQAMMISVKMQYNVGGPEMFERPSEDPELKYFIYMYTYEMAGLLKADPQRIKVASLSNGSVVINTVFTAVGEGDAEALAQTTERSPRALISLMQSLQQDTSSAMHASGSFFVDIDREYRPDPIKVRRCQDNTYRVFCPYSFDILHASSAVAYFMIGALVAPAALVALCLAAWCIDIDKGRGGMDEDILETCKNDIKTVEPPLQAEYARSWLEGRFMGEDWQKLREPKALTNGPAHDNGQD